MAAPGVPNIPDEQKAERVFAVLSADDRPRLTLPELAEATNMTIAQARIGWRLVRRLLHNMAVMEPHRHNSVYYLSDEYEDGIGYVFWQAQHIYGRVKSERRSLAALRRASAHRADVQDVLAEAEASLGGTWGNLRNLLRQLAPELGISPEKLARILADEDVTS